ncbi:hypothetical protein [Candidatus Ruthturnera calyptogenae]
MIDVITSVLASSDNIAITDFGSFVIRDHTTYTTRNS